MSEIIPHWLTKQAFLAPKQIAIETKEGDKITFLELNEKSEQFAKKLASSGVTNGAHVGIFSTNNVSMVIAIHALSYLGAVSVMLNTKLTKEELHYQISDGKVRTVLACDSLGPSIRQMNFPVDVKTFTDIDKQQESEVTLLQEINLDDAFTIIYTSGTTGFPKGVVHTFGNHWWSATGSALNLGLRAEDKWLAALPIFHVSGLSIFIRSAIYGMPVYLLEKFDEKNVHEAIMYREVTIVSIVTVMLQRLINLLEEGGNRYPPSFRCMLLGGGPAPEPLLEKAKKRNIPVFQSYGMTETASQIVTLSPEDALNKIGSAGKPLFPAQLKINSQNNDQVGEILVKGPMVTKGYFNNSDATKKAVANGWLATGDLGYVDQSGFLYVVDRRKDLIISGGENIYPSEIESVLSGMDEVKEVGVVGKNDDTWGKVPVAFIVGNSTLTEEACIAYAANYLAKYKLPKQIYFIDKLPRNASNKLVRASLLELLS
ncbi:O-succinylbenzoic acid--CoA ligase [Virgibacillus natechei]|uniref:2-succinylbenzoate--CoA ligase n=1 Tax=Virgibacillus natechei TaxID=1216297 RepID=A0ABS4IF41_9BACI|nr:o-succinylbenzoate--CoA ligase [Virgibacillus natechei]MBP1969557.1 O-succinylbenzoic acid--CoA ligase [Virgibacillus natechei]UZD11745.1 o-succinylbenzoate--CoA ligase [Virgibacillus natechei]